MHLDEPIMNEQDTFPEYTADPSLSLNDSAGDFMTFHAAPT